MRLQILLLLLSSTKSLADNNSEYLIQSENLPNNLNFLPSLSNGHLGYTVYGDAIYMNGIYNGRQGESRRARIPNWLNLSISWNQSELLSSATKYELNLKDGYFRWWQEQQQKQQENVSDSAQQQQQRLILEQRTYAHRFYNRALVYELLVQREGVAKEPLFFKLTQKAGAATDAFDFTHLNVADSSSKANETNEGSNNLKLLKGTTKIVEHEHFQKAAKVIYVAFSDDLETEKILQMNVGEKTLYYRYVITADETEMVALQEMHDILQLEPEEMLKKHAIEWNNFWNNFSIEVQQNLELSQTINAGIFYLANSLPSLNTNQPNTAYYGLSPTGLGRGQLDDDYEGHNFWDTEIWMLPVVTQFSTNWAEALLEYRAQHLSGAQYNANLTGYKGARFPWESAYTGTEVTNPCCPEVAAQQVHISADIAFALQHFYATSTASNERAWLCRIAWPIVREIAIFLESRVECTQNVQQSCHVKDVMGPDEDHMNVNDNVYTNVVFKKALEFASYTQQKCATTAASVANGENWLKIAQNMFILHDAIQDYHPQYVGYKQGTQVKQADVILLGYPLQCTMNSSTRLNDLNVYEHVTRSTGPAMTWSMFAINFLDVHEINKANLYFEKGYKQYVHPEFKVWSETKIGSRGSANFLTGIGGFMQAIINGYAGIRFYRDVEEDKMIMQVKKIHLLTASKAVTIKGIKFADATFGLEIASNESATLECLQVGQNKLELVKGNDKYRIFKGLSINLNAETIYIKTV